MFDYNELEVTGTFYIEFAERIIAEDVEALIRYWYKSWFDKLTNPTINWINYNAFSASDLVEIQINLGECSSNNYVVKDFLCATDYVKGDNRKSLVRTLTYGVNNAKTKIAKIDGRFNVSNTYNTKVSKDIPNPYIVSDFTVINGKLTTIEDLVLVVNKLKEQEDKKLTETSYEIDTNSRYALMRQHLDKLEVLDTILELTNKLK